MSHKFLLYDPVDHSARPYESAHELKVNEDPYYYTRGTSKLLQWNGDEYQLVLEHEMYDIFKD